VTQRTATCRQTQGIRSKRVGVRDVVGQVRTRNCVVEIDRLGQLNLRFSRSHLRYFDPEVRVEFLVLGSRRHQLVRTQGCRARPTHRHQNITDVTHATVGVIRQVFEVGLIDEVQGVGRIATAARNT
jgi:hypothetical protein